MSEIDPAEERVRADMDRHIAAYRNGEDPDLSGLLDALWTTLYARIPTLTASKDKDTQHDILKAYLVRIGFPDSPDLQYIAGPVLWYAREKGVIPPARGAEGASDAWTLDDERYAKGKAALAEGRTAYGDWMRDALKALLAERA
jgi:hypothetical protein